MTERADREEGFRAILDRHGHGFHWAVHRELKKLQIPWHVEPPELPVEVGEHSTHIDLVLRNRWEGSRTKPVFLVCECKRANPALSDWCFVPTHQDPRGRDRRIACDQISYVPGADAPPRAGQHELWTSPRVFDLAYPVKKHNQKGDEKGGGRDDISAALKQVTVGVNGLLELLAKPERRSLLLWPGEHQVVARVLPVVFTTAQLFATETTLDSADLKTGKVPETPMEPHPWLWFEYRVSPGLKHGVPAGSREASTRLSDYMREDVTRHIAFVSVDGLESFLGDPVWESY